MADQAVWFKLWCSALNDPELINLSLLDFGRWCKLGALVKQQGTRGTLTLYPPAKVLCFMFEVSSFDALLATLKALPKVSVSYETNAIVSFSNWVKYQGDYSTPRVRKFRENETPRREEKRREEKRGTKPQEIDVSGDGQAFVSELTNRLAKKFTQEPG